MMYKKVSKFPNSQIYFNFKSNLASFKQKSLEDTDEKWVLH